MEEEYKITEVEPFVQRFRDIAQINKDAQITQLNQERDLAQQKIMGEANKAGMLYSNFPARAKTQYDVNTYNPALLKIQTGYQTGLDSIRNKAVKLANYLKETQESIDDYNYYTSLLK